MLKYSFISFDIGHGSLERGRSSLRRGPTLSGGAGGGVGGGYGEMSNNPSFNFQQAMNDHFDHYKRPPSRDRSRDPSMDRFSRSSRQSSVARIARQESGALPPGQGYHQNSRGPSPAPTPISAGQHPMLRSTSRQRSGVGLALGGSNNSPALGAGRKADGSPIMGGPREAGSTSSSNSGSLQRRLATPIRVSIYLIFFEN